MTDKTIPQYSNVIFDPMLPEGVENQYLLKEDHPYIFFGEIPNMPGHCIVMDFQTGEFFNGYHTEHFIEVTKEIEERLGW